jgi:hypothetical protein
MWVVRVQADEIKLSCLENNGYESPELNDKLYLHFRGFKKIENLDAYTGCKAIWLDSNGFDKIENLEALTQLRCLYMSKNLISKVEGLQTLQNLHTLDLSYNRLTFLSGLSCCPNLNTLNVSRNSLATPDSVAHLQDCLKLTTIDLTHNCLDANESFFDVFKNIPSMSTLSINGNEITKLAHFRKKMIAFITKLGYLDRPIEEVEKVGAKAFVEGGPDAELAARNEYRETLRQQKAKEHEDFRNWQREQKKIREKEREEGRAKIMQFTEEELAQRTAEAKAAADAEKQMMELGIDKVAARYWQLEGTGLKSGSSALESLEEATRQLILERDSQTVDSDEERKLVPPPPPTEEELRLEAVADARIAAEAAERALFAEREAADKAKAETERAEKLRLEAQERKRLQAEEDARQRLVAESFRIYKAQLEAEKKQKNAGHAVPAGASKSIWESWENNDLNIAQGAVEMITAENPSSSFKSWESAAEVLCADTRAANSFYWTESMDMKLAQEVRVCVFDFNAVAGKLQAASMAGEFRVSARGARDVSAHNAEQFTAEACRLRWAQLSADQWCEFDSTKKSEHQPAVYKVCIPSEILGHGHGGQPTFEQLSKMSNKLPSYLKAPTMLPSVSGAEDDEDTDDDASYVGAEESKEAMADTRYEDLD